MPAKTAAEAQEVFMSSLPETGGKPYQEFYDDLVSRREVLALESIQLMKRTKQVATWLVKQDDGSYVTMIGRHSEAPPRAAAE